MKTLLLLCAFALSGCGITSINADAEYKGVVVKTGATFKPASK